MDSNTTREPIVLSVLSQERFLMLADHVEATTEESKIRFNMGEWFVDRSQHPTPGEPCGTSACLAGHAAILWDAARNAEVREYLENPNLKDAKRLRRTSEWANLGAEALGIEADPLLGAALFHAGYWPEGYYPVTPENAARLLRDIVAGGVSKQVRTVLDDLTSVSLVRS